MSYSIIGLLAILIHLIINRDVLFHSADHNDLPAGKEYRAFIIGIVVFCLTDVLWGFLSNSGATVVLYADTVLFFIAMMAGFLLWMRYVVAYMQSGGTLKRIISWVGLVLFICELVILAVNFFVPIQFHFDEQGVYHAGPARYVTLAMQVLLFLATSIYTLFNQAGTAEATIRLRRIVGLFGLVMAALIVIQLFYPYLPLYSIGYLIGSCLLHSFVVEDEKDAYRKTLEQMLEREKQQTQELRSARRRIYTDPLTGVKSKQAYLEDTEALNTSVCDGTCEPFAVAVFDLNGLKNINDTEGHDAGDILIYNASMLICEFFAHSPVYRIGGDEFAAILTGSDYANRATLKASFDRQAEDNLRSGKAVVASGMARLRTGEDKSYRDVFERADKRMYRRKKELKAGE